MGLARLEVLFCFVMVWEYRVLQQIQFFFINSVLDEGRTKGSSSSSSETIERFGRTRGLPSSSSSSSRAGAGYADFCSEHKLHVFLGEETAHSILAGTQDSSSPEQYVPA